MQGLVTVFGGSGFVGTQVVRSLAKKGLRVRIAVRNVGHAYRARMMGDVGQVEVVQANIRNAASIERALAGAEACINVVGQAYEKGPQTFEAVHVQGARLVAEIAAARGISRFVQFSGLGVDEASGSKYAAARARGEAAVRDVIPQAVILRPSVVFGVDDVFFNRLAGLASLSPVLPLIGGGAARLQPVFVGDVGKAAAAAVTSPAAAGLTYELGGPATYTFRELVELVMAVTGKKRALAPLPFAIADMMGLAGEIASKVLPIPPFITRDQVALFRTDNVVSPGMPGLAELGVAPTAVEPILPTYLYRYRKGGQFAEVMAGV